MREALDEIRAGKDGRTWTYTIQNGALELDQLNPLLISPGREQRLLEIQYQVAIGALEMSPDG